MAQSNTQRFDAKWSIDDKGFGTPCWVWGTDFEISELGYGRFNERMPDGTYVSVYAHRWNYEAHKGQIPTGMEIDHLCRVRSCVNPDHLEAVTHAENCRRKASNATTCKEGHPLNGERRCRTCYNAYQRAYQKRIKEQRQAVSA